MPVQRKPVGRFVVADPKVCHGQLTFCGTRILVTDMLELVAAAGRAIVEHADDYFERPVPA